MRFGCFRQFFQEGGPLYPRAITRAKGDLIEDTWTTLESLDAVARTPATGSMPLEFHESGPSLPEHDRWSARDLGMPQSAIANVHLSSKRVSPDSRLSVIVTVLYT